MREIHDVVVIGGGHSGLVAALTLADAGLSVCVAEARTSVGGCAVTTEPFGSSHRHSPHANSFIFADLLPPRLAPARLGVTLIQPEAQLGVAFADGRAPVILHRPDLLERTQANLAAYSPADAATYVDIKRRADRLGGLIRDGLYSPPNRRWADRQRRTVQQTFGHLWPKVRLGRSSARDLIEGLFETPEVRILMYALASETGVGLDDAGGDLAFLGYSLWIAGRWRIPLGGMQTYCDALREACCAAGVEVRVSTPVDRIRVAGGRAVGVHTSGGLAISAARGVVAAIPILDLFERLLPADAVSSSELAEAEALRRTRVASIGVSAFNIGWAPRYKSARHDPDIDRCLKTLIGIESLSDARAQAASLRAGLLPRAAGVVRVHSLWDDSIAPPHGHIAAVDSPFPPIGSMDRATWEAVQAAFPAALFETWQACLVQDRAPPPMTMTLDDALGFERRMLMRFGPDQYRTGVERLYMAGPGVYPGGGVHGACGHNAARVLIGDNRPSPAGRPARPQDAIRVRTRRVA